MKARTVRLVAVLALLLALVPSTLAQPGLALAQTSDPGVTALPYYSCTYVVQPGDTIFRLGLRFGVSPYALAAMNGIVNINLIYVGMVLRVPCANPPPTPNVCRIHIVQPGEWLRLIAARYGVSWQSIAALNHLSNPNILYAGQRLLISCAPGVPGRTITLSAPVYGQAVCSPVAVSGQVTVSPFESQLRGRVYNEFGAVVGEASVHVNAEMGKAGPFSGSLSFDTAKVRNGSFGRVELADLSPRDGSVQAAASVLVKFSCGY